MPAFLAPDRWSIRADLITEEPPAMDTDSRDPIELDLMHDPSDAQIAYLAGAYAPIVARLDCPGTRARLHAKTVAIATGNPWRHDDGCPAPLATTGTDTPWDNCTCQPPEGEPGPEEPRALDVRIVETPHGYMLYRHGRRYDHATGQPFYFSSRSYAFQTAQDEDLMEEWESEPAPEPDAMLVEARFTLETAREHIAAVRDRLPSDESSAMTLDLALAQITTVMSALP